MRVLITGVSGFLGPRLAAELLARGHRVSGTYLGSRPDLGPDVDLTEVDVTVDGELEACVARVAPERVAHLAALSHVGTSWREMAAYFRVNVLGTERLLATTEAPVVLASSAEVYGAVPEDEQPIAEDRPIAPANPYALTKAAAERLVLGRRGTVARLFNMAGPGQEPCFALPAFADQLASIARGEAEPVLRVGNLGARRDFTHVDDGTRGLALLVEQGEAGRVYNVASGSAYSIREALDLLLEASGVEVEVEVDEARLRPIDVPLLLGDPGRLEALGWRRRHDLATAVADLWRAVAGSGDE